MPQKNPTSEPKQLLHRLNIVEPIDVIEKGSTVMSIMVVLSPISDSTEFNSSMTVRSKVSIRIGVYQLKEDIYAGAFVDMARKAAIGEFKEQGKSDVEIATVNVVSGFNSPEEAKKA